MSDLTTTAVPDVELLKLQVTVRWARPHMIPGPVIANVLRGAVAITFRRLVCPEQFFEEECAPCPLYQGCAYGQLFAPGPSSDAQQLRSQQDLPRPFVLEPPGLHPEQPITPERLTFQLVLFGRAIDYLPFFITTIERLGRDGMGRDRVPYQIETVTALHPARDEVLFAGQTATLQFPERRISTAQLQALPVQREVVAPPSAVRSRLQDRLGLKPRETNTTPVDPARPRVRIRFRTPMLLKAGSYKTAEGRIIPAQEVRERPAFGVIARRLRDRLSSLCAFFGQPWQHPDFKGLGEAADQVEIIRSDTVWLSRLRQSTRTGQTHEISGFVGEADYQFPSVKLLDDFWPLLRIGELIHIGKHAPWGNGAIHVSELEERR